MTIRDGSITFNTACIGGLGDVVYVQVMFNENLKRLAVQGCNEDDKDALRWCIEKPDKRKSRKMTCRAFTDILYEAMDWDKNCRYKILGYRISYKGNTLYVFDFTVPETFYEKKAMTIQKAGAEQENPEPVNTRKGFYAEDIANTFGVPVEEHRQATEVYEMNGFATLEMLTGNLQQQGVNDNGNDTVQKLDYPLRE